jgi:molybdate transport system substrate-binding protein
MAKDIVGISSMATRRILADLKERYQRKTGQSVTIESVGGVDATRRVRAGEQFDVVILADDVMRNLEAEGHVKSGSRAGFAESAIAVAVRSGAALPILTDEATTKAAIMQARSICYSTGPSGTHLLKLFEKWDINRVMSERLVQAPAGIPVGALLARGEAELGFQQESELLDVPGIVIAGPLPREIQSLTLFSCGVGSKALNERGAMDLVSYLTSKDSNASKRRHGMEPP